MSETHPSILRCTDGLRFKAGPLQWTIKPLRLFAGQWVAFSPAGEDPVVDPSGQLARILASLSPPIKGVVELFETDVYNISYRDVQRLRARLGFVQGYGGLLSNRTIKENISLPASVHGGFRLADEMALVDKLLEDFSLKQIENFRPHEVDGYTRWRSCLARALVLSPKWVVLEGLGDWELDGGRGTAWTRLGEYHKRNDNVIAICMSRRNPEFESWFVNEGGVMIEYIPSPANS